MVTESYQNGSRYTGEKINGMRHGKGRMNFAEGGFYEGQWKDNTMCGKGLLIIYVEASSTMIMAKKLMKGNSKMANLITLAIYGINNQSTKINLSTTEISNNLVIYGLNMRVTLMMTSKHI